MRTYFKQFVVRVTVVLLFLTLPSCLDAPEGNKPVRVNFDIRFDVGIQTPAYFTFSRAILAINSIRFQGVRQAGNDVAFSTRPDQPLGLFVLSPSQFLRPVTWFDIQEGVYNSMRWEITLLPINDDFFDDDDEYGFILEGQYTRLDGTQVVVIFAMEEIEVLRLQTIGLNAQTQISLIVDRIYSIELVINPFSIFGGIPRTMLEQAEIQVNNGIRYLLISPDDNEELYDLMLLRLARELRAIIN